MEIKRKMQKNMNVRTRERVEKNSTMSDQRESNFEEGKLERWKTVTGDQGF